jgi:hypothetical protein
MYYGSNTFPSEFSSFSWKYVILIDTGNMCWKMVFKKDKMSFGQRKNKHASQISF